MVRPVLSGEAPIHLVIGMAGRSAYDNLDELNQNGAHIEKTAPMDGHAVYDGDAREISMIFYRLDGTIEMNSPAEAPLEVIPRRNPRSTGSSQYPIVAMFGAATAVALKYGR